MLRKAIFVAAVGFGSGYSPIAPGTVGTLLGVPLAVVICFLPVLWQTVCVVFFAAMAVLVCDIAEKMLGAKDDRRIVADEYLTFPLCMVGLPCHSKPWLIAAAFLAHRVADIIKPPPARKIQELPGGFGVAGDDVVSSLYALAFNHLLWFVLRKLG